MKILELRGLLWSKYEKMVWMLGSLRRLKFSTSQQVLCETIDACTNRVVCCGTVYLSQEYYFLLVRLPAWFQWFQCLPVQLHYTCDVTWVLIVDIPVSFFPCFYIHDVNKRSHFFCYTRVCNSWNSGSTKEAKRQGRQSGMFQENL